VAPDSGCELDGYLELLQTNSEAFSKNQDAVIGLAPAPAPFWPMKNGNVNRTGYLPSVAATNFSKPLWSWREPDRESKGLTLPTMKVFHGTPMIDGDLNVYIQSTTGWVYSVSSAGKTRWEFDTGADNPGNVALLDDAVFVLTRDGTAYSLDSATGAQLWKQKIAASTGGDTWSAAACEGFVIFPATEASKMGGTTEVIAVHPSDGAVLWRYSLGPPNLTMVFPQGMTNLVSAGYNQMPAIVDDSVLFTSVNGGAYRIGLQDGKEIWHTPGVPEASFTTAGGLVVGPNERVYLGASRNLGWGMLRVFDLATGEVLANKTFDLPLEAAPAVAPLSPGGPLAVFVTLGRDPECDPLLPLPTPARILALDAITLEQIWEFVLPMGDGIVAGVNSSEGCCPDVFGNPTVGGDGTVYINWSGGWAYAIRDANGDGTVDMDDSSEVTAFHHGGGSNGNTALAPGMAVAPSCWQLLGYASDA